MALSSVLPGTREGLDPRKGGWENKADRGMQDALMGRVRAEAAFRPLKLAKDCIFGFNMQGKNRSVFWYFILYVYS